MDMPYYMRFIGEGSEMWFFGSGLGEGTLAQQLGDSFLSLVDEGKDPHLGRVMWSLGYSPASMRPFKGDLNLVWSYGVSPEGLSEALEGFVNVRPDVILSPHKELREKAVELGMRSHHIHAGVGRFFKPLNIERTGVGFAGLDNKGEDQKYVVLQPAIDRGLLDWRSRNKEDLWMTVEQLNNFYNSLMVTFGMVDKTRQHIDYMPSRIFETLASDTPIITQKLHDFRKAMGFDYPYQTTSYEETEEMMDYIIDNQEEVLKEISKYGAYVRKNHNYKKKLSELFEELKNK